MHHFTALLVPELLEKILSHMDRNDNVVNMRVCKTWSEIALDLVWREVESLPRLFTLLRPYRQTSDGPTVFDRQPDLQDWARFQKYANRVRTLRYRQGQNDYSYMLDDMARTRTTLEILPNLHTLEWLFQDIKCMERATLFMHQRVKHLIISAPPLCYKVKSSFFINAYARMPDIQSLNLRACYAVRSIEADVLQLLRGLPNLKKVVFPEFYLTSIIVAELSRKKHINAIKFECEPELGLEEEREVDSFAPVLGQGAFPMLQDLDINVRLEDFVRFVNTDFAPTNITSLYINTYVEHKPKKLLTLLVALSQNCRLLSELHIKLLHVPANLKLVSAKQITFDTLKPVLSFLNLTTFEVMHRYPVHITLEEIEELASRWPSLENLFLNKEPLVMHDFTLDLRALIPFARHCPKLRQLGLFMDATAVKIHPTQGLKPFTALSVLSVGTSQARDPGTVAAFLSSICPPECRLEADMTWTSHSSRSCRELHDDVTSEVERRSTLWKTVGEQLPLFIQLWKEERERSRALQQEVENLRTTRNCLSSSMDKLEVDIKVNTVKANDLIRPGRRNQTNRRRKTVVFNRDDSCIIA